MRYIIFIMFFSLFLASCMGRRSTNSTASTMEKERTPRYGYTVKRVFPHSATSYTQGLVWSNGQMLEGTGQYNESALMKVDINNGKSLQSIAMPKEYFGEGVALFGGKIYQLTWLESTLFVYDAETFKQLKQIKYSGEGWGLTNDDTYLYMSDGSDKITIRDPETFNVLRTIEVRLNEGNRVTGLNEMEWIEGEIWANIYMSDVIVRIDPQSGKVTGIIDLEGILPESEHTPTTDVLNGIAYDSIDKRIYVTGKNWSKLFEIELVKR